MGEVNRLMIYIELKASSWVENIPVLKEDFGQYFYVKIIYIFYVKTVPSVK